MKFMDMLFGKSPKLKQMPNYSPQQQSFLDMLLQGTQQGTQGSMDWLNSLYDDDSFADYERPAMEQFNQQIVPGIMERFSGMGAKSSSGLNQALAQAGRGLSGDLAAQRGNMRMQGTQALQNYGQMGLTRQTTPYMQQGTEGAMKQIIQIMSMLGGMPGGAGGGDAFNKILRATGGI